MSADDFQTKYASVMEGMLKSAIAETTKLFETMVDELKAEISKIKKENEDLKTRCSQFENARRQTPSYIRESEPVPRRNDGSEKRDTAVQCDLVPSRTMLVEQCEPLRLSSLQNQGHQCDYDAMQYVWQEHNYENRGDRNSQMALILKQEGSIHSPQQSVFQPEEVEAYGQAFSDKMGLPRTSCEIQNEGHLVNQERSSAEIPLPVETQVALELPCLGMDSSLLEVHNKTSELEHALKGDMEVQSVVGPKISEMGTQGELVTSENHPLAVVPHQSAGEHEHENEQQSGGKISVFEQTDQRHLADVQSTEELFSKLTTPTKREVSDELKGGVSEGETSFQPDLPVRRRRGRPPKKAKHLQQPAKQISLPSSEISTEQEVKNSFTTMVKEAEVSFAIDSVNIISSKPSQGSLIQPKESSSIIALSVQERANTTLEDEKNSKVGSLTFSVSSLSSRCFSKKEKAFESQQLSTYTEDGAIQTPSTEVSCTVETSNTPTTGSPQATSVQSRERCTSVTLQDAMLLVEAMNQSTEENTFYSPQRIAAKTHIKCAPCVGTLQTVVEVPDEPATAPICVEAQEAAGNVPITELSKSTQLTKEELIANFQSRDATSTDEALAKKKVVTPKQEHMVTLSDTAKSSIPTSTAATQTSVMSLQQHPCHSLEKSVAHRKQGHAVPHKIIVMSRSLASSMPCKFPTQSPTQLSTMVSTVVAATDKSELPSSTPTGIPLRTGTPSHPKITIIIPRQQSAVASKKQSQILDLTTKQESAKSAHTSMLSSSQLMSLSQELSISVDAQTAVDEVATISSTKQNNNSDIPESPKQTASFTESINESKDISFGPVPTSMSLAEPQKLAVIRLTRLSFPMSTKEAVLLPSVPTNGSSETQSILKEDISVEKQSPFVIPTQRSDMQALSSDICSNSKDVNVAVPIKTSQMSEKTSDIQEKVSLTSEKGTIMDESTYSGYVQQSTLSEMSAPVFENSTVAIKTTRPSAVNGMAGEPTTSKLEKETSIAVQDYALPNDPPLQQRSPDIIHLMSIKSKDTFDPHIQMTKTQFLAQLAVSPVVQDPKKTSTSDIVDANFSCAETSTSDKKRLQNNTLVAKLRSHLKTHMQARTEKETCTEKESLTAGPKKPRLDKDSPDDKSMTCEPITLSPKNPETVVNVIYPKKTTNDPSSISTRRSGICKESARSNRLKGKDSLRSKNKKSTSVSPSRSDPTKESASPKMTKSTPVSSRVSSSTKESASPKKIKTTTVHSRRTSSTTDCAYSKSTKTAGCSINTETPKRTKSTSVGQRKAGLNKNSTSPKMATNELTSLSRRQLTFSKESSSTKPRKRESNLIRSRSCSTTAEGSSTNNTKRGTNLQRVGCPKFAEGVSSCKTGVSTAAKKPKLIQEVSGASKNLRVMNSKKLAKSAKAKTVAKMKNYQSNLQNGAKTSQLSEKSSSCETVKTFTAKAVWTPPLLATNKTPPAGGKRSLHSFVKKETRSQNQTPPLVYPPSVSLHPIPVRAPPVVSPLQPLSVIGWRLLKNQCGECGRVLSSSAALESHVSLHTGRRPFSCTLCGKSFPDSKGLRRHGRVHRNGRIHICPQCGKGFVYSFGLTKHLQVVHSRIKPFVCHVCNKGFFAKRDVEAHIRIHTGEKPFHCNLCEKKFARRTELNVHLRWHNGEKRHWCPYCGKGFLDINNLKRHKYTHTGEKPHSCPHCPKHFTQSGHLKKHVKNVHKIQ
uniref:uncharacterized protein n=1 Tax=Semicossyphus pulcher TaxID=241346 RepID=UPI0037E78CE8